MRVKIVNTPNQYGEGGNMNTDIPDAGQHGGYFSNDVRYINAGGTHEENPNQGVQQGISQDGQPNLVEQGEVIYNDYVFSKRLDMPDKYKAVLGIQNKGKVSFADAAKELTKESSERPNDPISNNGKAYSLNALQQMQEKTKFDKLPKKQKQAIMMQAMQQMQQAAAQQQQAQQGQAQQQQPGQEQQQQQQQQQAEQEAQQQQQMQQQGQPPMMAYGGHLFDDGGYSQMMRDVPIYASGLQVATDAMGLTNKPDMSDINEIRNFRFNTPQISAGQLSQQMDYQPIDTNYMLNKLNANYGATVRQLQNSSNGNRGQLQAGLLAAGYNTQNAIGDTLQKAYETNRAQQLAALTFNRETDKQNIANNLAAAEYNSKAAFQDQSARYTALQDAYKLKDAATSAASAARSANQKAFYENVAAKGKEQQTQAMAEGIYGMHKDQYGNYVPNASVEQLASEYYNTTTNPTEEGLRAFVSQQSSLNRTNITGFDYAKSLEDYHTRQEGIAQKALDTKLNKYIKDNSIDLTKDSNDAAIDKMLNDNNIPAKDRQETLRRLSKDTNGVYTNGSWQTGKTITADKDYKGFIKDKDAAKINLTNPKDLVTNNIIDNKGALTSTHKSNMGRWLGTSENNSIYYEKPSSPTNRFGSTGTKTEKEVADAAKNAGKSYYYYNGKILATPKDKPVTTTPKSSKSTKHTTHKRK